MSGQDGAATIDSLLAALAAGDPRDAVFDRLARVRAMIDPDGPAMAAVDVLRVLEGVAAALERDALRGAVQRQRAQYRQMALRQALTEVLGQAGPGRVHGDAAALNLAFARALAAAPRRHRQRLFDRRRRFDP